MDIEIRFRRPQRGLTSDASSNEAFLSSSPTNLSRRGLVKSSQGKRQGRILSVLADPYDAITNPNGYINLAVAENRLMLHRVEQYINTHVQIEASACSYGIGGTGSLRLKHATAALLNDRFDPHVAVGPENIQFSAGCNAICEMLGWNLADEGDAVLLSAPIYGAYTADFTFKAGLRVVHVSTGHDDPLGPRAPAYYQSEIERLLSEGIKPRILLICTPHNPLGRNYERTTMIELCRLAAKHDMHLISDEVFALSTFEPFPQSAVPFTSLLSIPQSVHNLPAERMHVLYGFSKDIAAAGLRLGCLITRNKDLLYAMGAMSPMHWPSSLSDTAVATMLEDREWLNRYIADSQVLLAKHHRYVCRTLDAAGIPYQRGTSAGFFVWADFSAFLPDEVDGKGKEEVLGDIIFEKKVWPNMGAEFSAGKEGWIRIVFTLEKDTLKEGLARLLGAVRGEDIAERAVGVGFW